MRILITTTCSSLCLASLMSVGALAASLDVAWEATGFERPESVVFNQNEGVLYVSNINGDGMAADGNGYISKMSTAGEVLEKEWATRLNGPKGMALHDGMLYVSDINELAVIDVASGEITATYEAPDAKFLNDVAAHEDGRVFVSDIITNKIHVLENDSFEVWLQDDALENPNGLFAEADRLLVGAWGTMAEDFSTEVPGHLKAVDYETKAITSLGDGQPVGNLDGVEPDGKGGYLVTDWMSGGLYRFSADGEAEMLLDLNQGSADHEVVEAEGIVVIPMMMDDTVTAYRLD
ncbi:MAG: SMP-30/gluconolactonase/LRE family protein [Geminicoccaceae bacterium]